MTSRRSPRAPVSIGRGRDAEVEETLAGGTANRGLVVRVGDTVRRPLRDRSASTHALLRHLESVGFEGAPRFLGVDTAGREVLTYVEGRAALPPYPAWGLTDVALDSVAVLLREFHDATASFDPRGLTWTAAVPPEHRDGAVVSHNDPNLDNVLFRDGRAVALIDFDLSAPGSRLWDVACAARLWAPLRPDDDIDDTRRGSSLSRLRRFVDTYGLSGRERGLVLDTVIASHEWTYRIVRRGAESGSIPFREYWQRGGAERAARARAWYDHDARRIRDALA